MKHNFVFRMLHLIGRFFSVALFGVVISAPAMVHASPPAGYKLVWSDEFNQGIGKPPLASNWNIETGNEGVWNKELERYVSDIRHSSIVKDPNATDGRALQITATDDNGKTGDAGVYRSARLDSLNHEMPQYGFIEARIKLPAGKGIWPAFWMLGADQNKAVWPACGEMDIMENIGEKQWLGVNQASMHSPGHFGANSQHAIYTLPGGQAFSEGYHLFQLLWSPGSASFYVDGNLYETRSAAEVAPSPWPFNARFFFIINLAVGGNWPGSPDASTRFPQKMLLDYVRVYSGTDRKPAAPAGFSAAQSLDGGQAALSWTGSTDATAYIVYKGSAATGKPLTQVAKTACTYYLDNDVKPGSVYSYKVVAINGAGQSASSATAHIKVSPARESAFEGHPSRIPGVIPFTNFDNGGEGIGYHNGSTAGSDGIFRKSEHVTMAATQDSTGLFDIGYNASGNWLKYTVVAAKAGDYTVDFRVASGGPGGLLHLENGQGKSLSGLIKVPGTGGWETWMTVRAKVRLAAGKQVIKLVEDQANYNLNYMAFLPN